MLSRQWFEEDDQEAEMEADEAAAMQKEYQALQKRLPGELSVLGSVDSWESGDEEGDQIYGWSGGLRKSPRGKGKPTRGLRRSSIGFDSHSGGMDVPKAWSTAANVHRASGRSSVLGQE